MKNRTLLFSIFSFLLLAFQNQTHKPNMKHWVIIKNCSLKVGGSTNVNKFNCVIANYANPDTITFYKNTEKGSLKLKGSIELNVQNFDCHHPVMTADLRKTLKAKVFPKLVIRFISLDKYPLFNDQSNAIKGIVAIELAGVTKRFEVNYRFVSNGTKSLILVGSRQVNFSDFNIIPPRKLGGMIKTNNELKVEFTLSMKVID